MAIELYAQCVDKMYKSVCMYMCIKIYECSC